MTTTEFDNETKSVTLLTDTHIEPSVIKVIDDLLTEFDHSCVYYYESNGNVPIYSCYGENFKKLIHLTYTIWQLFEKTCVGEVCVLVRKVVSRIFSAMLESPIGFSIFVPDKITMSMDENGFNVLEIKSMYLICINNVKPFNKLNHLTDFVFCHEMHHCCKDELLQNVSEQDYDPNCEYDADFHAWKRMDNVDKLSTYLNPFKMAFLFIKYFKKVMDNITAEICFHQTLFMVVDEEKYNDYVHLSDNIFVSYPYILAIIVMSFKEFLPRKRELKRRIKREKHCCN